MEEDKFHKWNLVVLNPLGLAHTRLPIMSQSLMHLTTTKA